MTTVFKSHSDEQVKHQVFSNFSFLTGESRPESKGTTKNDDGITEEMWFVELSWVNMFIFCQAFHEATARGILNAFEQRICQELFDML